MTEDFARDIRILRDLLQLASDRGHAGTLAYNDLNGETTEIEEDATAVMTAVQALKAAFNEQNRDLMMGFWIATFVDPVDPPFEEATPGVVAGLNEAELIARARVAGTRLRELLDKLKRPHLIKNDNLNQGGDLTQLITDVEVLVAGDLGSGHAWLKKKLDAMTASFTKMGGGGGESTYWPSNYVSSSSSSSSSSSYP